MSVASSRLAVGAAFILLLGCEARDQPEPATAMSPADAAAELLAADSAFSATGASQPVATSLAAMFAPDVTIPAPQGRFAVGADAAVDLLRSNPENISGHATWTPIRVGLSADGLHGFTFGYGITVRGDSTRALWKYLAYWVKGPSGWRTVAYKRGPRAAGDASLQRMAPALPDRLVAPGDSASVAEFAASLDQAERSFSDLAQEIGLGPAFVRYGRADAVNMGGPDAAAFVVGAEAIGATVGQGGPPNASPVSWAPDRVIVASSGDLGVTIGLIRPNDERRAAAGPGFAFFTVWYRATPADPWRYIAE